MSALTTTRNLQDMRNILYSLLKEDQDSTAYPYVLVDSLINQIQQDICSGSITDLTTSRKEQIEKAALPFLFSDVYYSTIQDTYISAWITIGATVIPATNVAKFADAWFLWINEDIVQYTWKTATSFTWVTGVDFAHIAGARISQLFELPDDYSTINRVVYHNQFVLKEVDYRKLYLQLDKYKGNYYSRDNLSSTNSNIDRFPTDIRPFYTNVYGRFILPFQIEQDDYMIHAIYEKEATEMVNATDLCTIPNKYAQVTTPILAAADLLYNRGEEDRALKLHNFGLGKIMSMYSFYSDVNNEELNGQRIETGKDQVFNI